MHETGLTVVTGGSIGIPGIIVETAHQLGTKTIVFSPDKNHEEHATRHDNHVLSFYDDVFFCSGLTERSLKMINFVDAALILNGRMGTLSEFCISVEEGLPLSIITGTGGISDELTNIITIANKEFPSEISSGPSYKEQIDFLIEHTTSEHRYQIFRRQNDASP